MKKNMLLIAVLSIVLMTNTIASYAVDCTIIGDVVTISGTSYADLDIVPVVVTKPDIDASALNDSNIKENVIFVYQAVPADDGSIEIKIKLPQNSPAGWYSVYTQSEYNRFYYASELEKSTAVAAFVGSTEATVADTIKAYSIDKPVICLDLTGIYSLFASYVQKVFVHELHSDTPTKTEDVQSCFAKAIKMAEFVKGNREAIAEKLSDAENGAYLDLPNTSDEVADMFIKLRTDEIISQSQLELAMRSANALTKLNKADRTTVMQVASNYNDIFELNLTGNYLKCNSIEVGKALAGKSFTSVTDVQTAFNARVEKLSADSSSSSSSSASSGSSIGSGPSFSASINNDSTNNIPHASQPSSYTFTDMNGYEWADMYVCNLASRGIINGVGEGKFAPGDLVTREQYLKMLSLAVGAFVETGNIDFIDVDPDAWYAGYVSWGSANGIVKGVSPNRFGIGDAITREDMCVMANRALGYAGVPLNTLKTTFVDVEHISDYALNSVAELVNKGIINGRDDGFFAPKDYCTRAEAAKVIYLIAQIGGAANE